MNFYNEGGENKLSATYKVTVATFMGNMILKLRDYGLFLLNQIESNFLTHPAAEYTRDVFSTVAMKHYLESLLQKMPRVALIGCFDFTFCAFYPKPSPWGFSLDQSKPPCSSFLQTNWIIILL